MERYFKIIVAELESDHRQSDNTDYECEYNVHLEQKVFDLDELLKQDWFIETLRHKGYYNKDQIDNSNNHLNRFVYEYKNPGSIHSYFDRSIKSIYGYDNLVGVYQEVIGPERIKGYAKWKKEREDLDKKNAEKIKKQKTAYEKKKLEKKLKNIEKAKKLLEEEGVV